MGSNGDKTIDIKNHKVFGEGITTVEKFKKSLDNKLQNIENIFNKQLTKDNFQGDISTAAKDEFNSMKKNLENVVKQFAQIQKYLEQIAENYKDADANSSKEIMETNTSILIKDKNGELKTVNSDNLPFVEVLCGEAGKNFYDYNGKFKYSDDWCAEWVSTFLDENGYNCSYAISAGRDSIIKAVEDGGGTVHAGPVAGDNSYSPQPGDVFTIDTDGDGNPNHVGFVVADNGGKLVTIEGNTMKKGQTKWIKNQGVVRMRTDRKKEDICYYATPAKK